jgi:hypothetical protein
MLVSRGLLEEPDPEDAVAHLQAESLQTGLPWRLANQRSSSRLAVELDGYSLEAGTHVHEHDGWGCSICVGMGCGPRSLKSGCGGTTMAVSSWSYTAPPTTALAPSASPRTNSFGISRRSCRPLAHI